MATRMQFTVNGETLVYDGKLMLPEAIAIEKATGRTQAEWEGDLQRGSAAAQAALIWVLLKRRGQIIDFRDLTYDTHALDVKMLREDGTEVDLEALAARAEKLIADGMPREQALKQAHEEAFAVKAEPEPENPTAGAATVVPAAPQPTPSSEPQTPTPATSPTTSASVPGSVTG